MKVRSNSFTDGGRIPSRCAFGRHADQGHIALAENRNPHIAWSDLPEGTRSLALICRDADVPSRGDDVNQEGRVVPADLPRVDFYHWLIVDLDPAAGEIAEGAFCDGVTARGKAGPQGPDGTRQGVNDYSGWFAGDADMSGDYYGFDGPCPPWNDTIVHHYHFTIYALDVDRCPVEGRFDGTQLVAAVVGLALESASIVGTYAINPSVPY